MSLNLKRILVFPQKPSPLFYRQPFFHIPLFVKVFCSSAVTKFNGTQWLFRLFSLSVKSSNPGLLNEVLSDSDRGGMCQSSNRLCCVLICQKGDRGEQLGLAGAHFLQQLRGPSKSRWRSWNVNQSYKALRHGVSKPARHYGLQSTVRCVASVRRKASQRVEPKAFMCELSAGFSSSASAYTHALFSGTNLRPHTSLLVVAAGFATWEYTRFNSNTVESH